MLPYPNQTRPPVGGTVPPLPRGEDREVASFETWLSVERGRAKNTLQVAASLLALQGREAGDASVQAFLTEAQERIRVMAVLYDRLARSGPAGKLDFADALRELAALTFHAHPVPGLTHQVKADPLFLDLDAAIPLGLIAHELLNDAVQNAFTGRENGKVELTVRFLVPDHYELAVMDDGINRPSSIGLASASFRSKILEIFVRQLKGRLACETIQGTRVSVRFPTPLLS